MMRRSVIACALFAPALAFSCGGEKNTADEKPSAEKAATPQNQEPAKSTEAALPQESAKEKIVGKATQTAESGDGPESEIALFLLDGGRLGGELTLGKAKCAISGMVEEAVARAWLSCPAVINEKKRAACTMDLVLGLRSFLKYDSTLLRRFFALPT